MGRVTQGRRRVLKGAVDINISLQGLEPGAGSTPVGAPVDAEGAVERALAKVGFGLLGLPVPELTEGRAPETSCWEAHPDAHSQRHSRAPVVVIRQSHAARRVGKQGEILAGERVLHLCARVRWVRGGRG